MTNNITQSINPTSTVRTFSPKRKKATSIPKPLFKRVKGKSVPTHPWVGNFVRAQGAGEQEISGALAQHLLDHFNTENRNVSSTQVRILLTEFRHGQFVPNSENLGFTRQTGQIQDGQHRLLAFVRYAKEKSPDNWENETFRMNITYSLDPNAKKKTNLGKGRTMFDVSKLDGVDLNSLGKKALTVIKNHLIKSPNGNGLRRELATLTDIIDMRDKPFPTDASETYASVATEFITVADKNAVYPLSNGHLMAVYDLAAHVSLEKARDFLYLVTAETANLARDGVDDTFSSVELSSIKRCRAYLKQKFAERPHNGGSYPQFYGTMLCFIEKYFNEENCQRIAERTLRTEEEYEARQLESKGGRRNPDFHWGLVN